MDHICYLCFVFVCHTALSVPCSLVVTCFENSLVFDVFLCCCRFPIWYPWIFLFVLFVLYIPVNIFFSYVRAGLPKLNQY